MEPSVTSTTVTGPVGERLQLALKTHLFSTARRHWDVFMILAPHTNIQIYLLIANTRRPLFHRQHQLIDVPGPAGGWAAAFTIILPSLFLNSDTPTPPPARTFTGSAGATGFSFFTSCITDSTTHLMAGNQNNKTKEIWQNLPTTNTDVSVHEISIWLYIHPWSTSTNPNCLK